MLGHGNIFIVRYMFDHLGLYMSQSCTIVTIDKACETLDAKVEEWKKEIEDTMSREVPVQ